MFAFCCNELLQYTFLDLPNELIVQILKNLDILDRINIVKIIRRLNKLHNVFNFDEIELQVCAILSHLL